MMFFVVRKTSLNGQCIQGEFARVVGAGWGIELWQIRLCKADVVEVGGAAETCIVQGIWRVVRCGALCNVRFELPTLYMLFGAQ